MSSSDQPNTTPERGEIFELTGLRGIAALMVALLHLNFDIAGGFGDIYDDITRTGFLGVDLFFILSGFVIAYRYNYVTRFQSGAYLKFIWFRFWRIYPTHFFVTLFYVPVVAAAYLLGRHVDAMRFSVSSLVANLLLVQSWLGSDAMTWNSPAWTVSAEWLAYVVFPALMTLSSRVPRSLVLLNCAFLLLSVPALFFIFDISGAGFTGLVRLFPEFLCGTLLWRLYEQNRTRTRTLDVGLGIVLVLMLTCGLYVPVDRPFLALPLFAGAIYLSCRSAGFVSRCLSSRAMVFLGTISYSLYLVHWPIFSLLRGVLPAATPLSARLVIGLSVAILVAALAYRFIEAPCRQYGKRLWGSGAGLAEFGLVRRRP
jgi:peptidoglycan/LPS O-acetylase OafA/YrhL